MIRNFFNQYFSFSKAEKNGTVILVVLIIFVLAGYIIMPKIIVNRTTDFTDFKNEIEAFEQLISSAEDDVLSLKNGEKTFENMDNIQFFEFDPNDLSVDKWKHLGLSEKTINTIRKYLKKGGRFYKPEDLKKIYGLKMDWYKRAEPYIKIRQIKLLANYIYSRPIYFTIRESGSRRKKNSKRHKMNNLFCNYHF